MDTILTKNERWFNPYFLNGKQINQIKLFDNKGVKFSFNWFGSNNKYYKWKLPCKVINKRKKDFSLDKGFLFKEVDEFTKLQVYNLYLPLNKFSYTIKQNEERNKYKIIKKGIIEIEVNVSTENNEEFISKKEKKTAVLSVEYTKLYDKNKGISKQLDEEFGIKIHPFDIDFLKEFFNNLK